MSSNDVIKDTFPSDVLVAETEAGRHNGLDRAAGGERGHRELPAGNAPSARTPLGRLQISD